MTTEQKELLIEKMIDRPESLSQTEIDQIFADEELADLYNISVKIADELTPIPTVDIDTEWMKLRCAMATQSVGKKPTRRWIGIAASMVGILLCGGLALRFALIYNSISTSTENIVQVAAPAPQVPSETTSEIETVEHQSVATVKSEVQYAKHQKSQLPAAKQHDEVDIEEYIRIEQARIDNEVALARSEVYRAEYDSYIELLVEMLLSNQIDEIDPELLYNYKKEINRLTMI